VLVGGFDGCKRWVSRVFHECFAGVSQVFRGCFAGVSRVSHRVFREFRGCLAAVSQLFCAVSQQICTVNLCKKPAALRYLEARRSTLQPRRMASTHGLDATLDANGAWSHCTHPLKVSIPRRYLDATASIQPRSGLDVGSTLGSMRPASTARRQSSDWSARGQDFRSGRHEGVDVEKGQVLPNTSASCQQPSEHYASICLGNCLHVSKGARAYLPQI
jgi:hypothetical protein